MSEPTYTLVFTSAEMQHLQAVLDVCSEAPSDDPEFVEDYLALHDELTTKITNALANPVSNPTSLELLASWASRRPR